MDKQLVPTTPMQISPEYLERANALREKKVPANAIKVRPGKGGKTFSYIAHTWATETLQDVLKEFWSFDTIQWEVFEDNSVAALVRLTQHVPYTDSRGTNVFSRSVTEIGAFDNMMKIPKAMAVAAAVSRGLCRCMMRMFGLGIEFYKAGDEGEMSAKDAWNVLWRFAQNKGMKDQNVLVAALKDKGISGATLVDNFQEAYHIVAVLVGSAEEPEATPEGL